MYRLVTCVRQLCNDRLEKPERRGACDDAVQFQTGGGEQVRKFQLRALSPAWTERHQPASTPSLRATSPVASLRSPLISATVMMAKVAA